MGLKLLFLLMLYLLISGCGSQSDIDTGVKSQTCEQSYSAGPYVDTNHQHRKTGNAGGQIGSGSVTTRPKTASKDTIYGPSEPSKRLDKRYSSAASVMEKRIDLSFVSSKATFSETLDGLRESLPERLNITVLWRDLERAGIGRDTEIGMEPIASVELKTALKLLLEAVSAGENLINYKVVDGIIVIATNETLAKFGSETIIYDISDLGQLPAEYKVRTNR